MRKSAVGKNCFAGVPAMACNTEFDGEFAVKNFDRNEMILFRRVMNEGNDKGVFDIRNVKLMAMITHYCLKGCEVPYIYGRIGVSSPEELYPYVFRMVNKTMGNDRYRNDFRY